MAIRINEFLDTLVERKFLTERQSQELSDRFHNQNRALLHYLEKSGLVPRDSLARLWTNHIGIPWVDLAKTLFQNAVLSKLPEQFCRKYSCIPLYEMGSIITLAMDDPTNLAVIEEAERLALAHVSPVFALTDEIEDALSVQYNTIESIDTLMRNVDLDEFRFDSKDDADKLDDMSTRESIVELTAAILLWAVKERASDIHVEPHEYKIVIRFRIDGLMRSMLEMERPFLRPIIARLKVLANVDITERRKPQDGRINLKLKNDVFDYRFSTVPSIYGEKAVLRVLGANSSSRVPLLEEIGLSKKNLARVKQITESPNGIFFVTGPTGSGKSTALFSMLQTLDSEHLNIMTIENPVEYRLEGITQIEVDPLVGLGFATILGSILRQDPDVILVGEVRDSASAHIAAEAALTGHLVLSSLHTNNAIQAVTRLIEIGVEPFLVAPAIIGVMAQRLVRRLCTSCRLPHVMTAEEIEANFVAAENTVVEVFAPGSCRDCNHTGYRGRIAIHELLIINDPLRSLIARDAPLSELEALAETCGFESMRYDGLKKVLRGLTSVKEIDRVTLTDTNL